MHANETFGLALLEAVARGVPIVAYPTCALAPRFAAAGGAYPVDEGNRDVLAGAIQEISESPKFGDQLATAAQTLFAESFSYSAYTISWSRLLGRFRVQSSAQRSSV